METIKYILLVIVSMIVVYYTTVFTKKQYTKKLHVAIEFQKDKHEFDTLRQQKDAQTYFVYKNTGNRPLIIEKITTSCGCTIPSWNKNPLAPNQLDSFRVEYNIENKGYFIKEVMVYTNSKNSPHHISISGFVPFE